MKANKIFLIKFLLSLVVFSGYTLPSYILAQDYNTVVINELMWTGSESSSSDEWIELKNMTDQEIDLSGYKIKYANDNEMVSISSGKIPANGYFLIANSDQSHQYTNGESILDIAPDYIDAGVSLSNSNLQIKLIDSNDNIIDTAGDGGKPLAGNNDKKYSMERNDISPDGTLSSSWHTATSATNIDLTSSAKATPKSVNSPSLFQPITSYPTDLDKYITIDSCLEAQGKVNYIVDGDTLDIDLNGEKVRVRFIGIDAPESSKSSDFGFDEPYYAESKDYILNLLLNKDVTIIVSSDPNQQYDSDNRLLAVIIFDDTNINLSSIQEGLSRTYYLDNPIVKKDSWIESEKLAQQNHFGIWKYFNLSSDIYINEIMPNPSGDDSQNEWIEIYNSSDQKVDLANWFVDDSKHGSNPYLIPAGTTIDPYGYYVILASDSRISLNNSGDLVRLYTPDLNIANEIDYQETAKENISYMNNGDKFVWSKTPTMGYKNIYTDPDASNYTELDKLSDIKDIQADEYVSVEGYVNSDDHQLSDQYFYIEDESAGVQIYNYNKNFPTLEIGQKVRILGQVSDTNYLRIKITDSNQIIFLTEYIIFEPPKLTPNKINEKYAGMLITAQGEISKLSGDIFYIKDETSELKIQIRGPTNIKRPQFKKGDAVSITGVLYESSQKTFTLLPRFLEDIHIVRKKEESSVQYIYLDNISQASSYKEDDQIVLRGIVNSLPGTLGEQYFYIQDETAGIEIYSFNKYFPSLNIGDYIEVHGKLSKSKTRLRIYSIDDIQILSSNNSLTTHNLSTSDNVKKYFGMLVFVDGVVISKNNQKIYIMSDGKKYVIYLKDHTNIKPSFFQISDHVALCGIVDEYSGEYRINPRSLDDINIISRKTKNILSKLTNTVEQELIVKSYTSSAKILNHHKYLVKAPKNKYNLVVSECIVKTIICISNLILLIIIIEWLCQKKQYI